MSSTNAPVNPFQMPRTTHHIRRQVSNALCIGFAILTAAFSILVLFYLVIYIIKQGLPYLNLGFFTQLPASFGSSGGGMGEAIQGTLVLVGLASVVGIPLGLFMAIYLSEYGKGRFSEFARFMVDVLNGVPTIIFGLFAWVLIVIPAHGFSALSGGLALGIIMIPIVARTAEDVLRLVPKELREASLALGATKARTILQVIVPAASSGIVTGIVLAMARVAGETAPLLMTAFGSTFWGTDVTQPIDALPLRIFVFTTSPYQIQINQAYAGSIVLVALILITSFAVRWATGGFKRRF
jgi:phosphate transport system permease protein